MFESAIFFYTCHFTPLLNFISPLTFSWYNVPVKNVSRVSIFDHRYEKNWDKPNKTKLLQGALERAGRLDLAERLHCLHWGHQKLSQRVELPSAFPFLIAVHKTMRNQDALQKINDLNHKHL